MSSIPLSHVKDSHQLIADARLDMFELTPADGSGTIYFKNDADLSWRSHLYEGIPLSLTGEKKTSDTGLTMPKLVIGQENLDLSQFKPLIFDGGLDNAVIIKKTALLANILANLDIYESQTYRVKRVESYNRSQINLQLATLSDSLGFSLPYRAFTTPDFPTVTMT